MNRLVVGIDMGGTANNVTVVDGGGAFLVDRLVEGPSRTREGPKAAVEALVEAFGAALGAVGANRGAVVGVGLGTPGPASNVGVLSSRGATNFAAPAWWGFDLRGALEAQLGIPVTYSNDGNAAALYAHHTLFGAGAALRSSVAAIVGTGLGGGVVVNGSVVAGRSGMGGELGHVRIPLDDVLDDGQPLPHCGCGRIGDAESVASLTAISRNLLPYWLPRFPGHPLGEPPVADAAKQLRAYAERSDDLARTIFDQQAAAIGALFTIVADVIDPDAYFVGGGVVEADPSFRDWFLGRVRAHLRVRPEQSSSVEMAPDGDMAGARGAALASLATTSQATNLRP